MRRIKDWRSFLNEGTGGDPKREILEGIAEGLRREIVYWGYPMTQLEVSVKGEEIEVVMNYRDEGYKFRSEVRVLFHFDEGILGRWARRRGAVELGLAEENLEDLFRVRVSSRLVMSSDEKSPESLHREKGDRTPREMPLDWEKIGTTEKDLYDKFYLMVDSWTHWPDREWFDPGE